MINWSQKLFTFYSRLDPSVIIMYHHKLYLLLVILVVSCHAAFEETSRFLTDNGFGHVSQQFVEEEIEVCQIPSLTDQVRADLGVRTVGARLRLRSAASQWVPNQVISFLSRQDLLLCQHLAFRSEATLGLENGRIESLTLSLIVLISIQRASTHPLVSPTGQSGNTNSRANNGH